MLQTIVKTLRPTPAMPANVSRTNRLGGHANGIEWEYDEVRKIVWVDNETLPIPPAYDVAIRNNQPSLAICAGIATTASYNDVTIEDAGDDLLDGLVAFMKPG